MDEIAEPNPPQTLADSHEALARIRPRRKAPPAEWLAYHQRAAAWYAEIAEIDRGHHHEALHLAEQERKHAKKTAQIREDGSVEGDGGGEDR